MVSPPATPHTLRAKDAIWIISSSLGGMVGGYFTGYAFFAQRLAEDSEWARSVLMEPLLQVIFCVPRFSS
jgi:hypothetical protein